MGLQLSKSNNKSVYARAARPFALLDSATLYAIGKERPVEREDLSEDQFLSLLSKGSKGVQYTDEQIGKLFELFDTERCGRVDAWPALAAIALVSTMTLAGKLRFIYEIFDTVRDGAIAIEQALAAVKDSTDALFKMINIGPRPTEEQYTSFTEQVRRVASCGHARVCSCK